MMPFKNKEDKITYNDKYYNEHREDLLNDKKEWHLNNVEKHRASALKWARDNKQYLKEKHQKERLQCLTHYSEGTPKCACLNCNEDRIEFLSIDHINGGGHQHREKIKRRGIGFFKWLIDNNFPEGYRVLCHNCNQSRGYYGYCPHEKENNIEVIINEIIMAKENI